MIPDSLESLSGEELSEVFAVEVAGWKDFGEHSRAWGCRTGFPPLGEGCMGPCPPFATSADSVLPYLEKASQQRLMFTDSIWYDKMGDYWTVELRVPASQAMARDKIEVEASHASFARAVCLALIKAHRAAKSHT